MIHNENEDTVLITNKMSLDNYPIQTVVATVQRTQHRSYCMLNCDDNFICYNDIYTGLYNSVVFSFPERELISYSPSKSITYEYFKNLFPIMTRDIMICEHIDGVMVQLFYDQRIQEWEIATSDVVGGSNRYLCNGNTKTIKQIFVEALGGVNHDLKSLPFLEYFPINCSFSFIIKIDEKSTAIPECYLISIYYVNDLLPNTIQYIHDTTYKAWSCIECINGLIKYPKKYVFATYNELEEDVEFLHDKHKYTITHLKSGVKTNLQTVEYTIQERIKKSKKEDVYRFICLNRIDNTNNIGTIFPVLRTSIAQNKATYELFIGYIHKIYRDYFIKKSLCELPMKYKKYILNIHKICYIQKIKKNNKKPIVMRSDIKTYFNAKMPHELYTLMYIL